MIRILFFVVGLAGAAGCGADAADAACEGLDEAGCDADAACTSVFAAPDCGSGEEVYAGCATAENVQGCDDAETSGGPADGPECFLFPNSCMPDGFAACDCDDPA